LTIFVLYRLIKRVLTICYRLLKENKSANFDIKLKIK